MAPLVPELDFDQAALGQWVDHKFPRGVYTRRWLAEAVKQCRVISRPAAIQLHQELLRMVSNLERDALKVRQQMRRDLERMMPYAAPFLAGLDSGGTYLEVLRAVDGILTELKGKGGIQ
jgi:hypothetical protein